MRQLILAAWFCANRDEEEDFLGRIDPQKDVMEQTLAHAP
jgi:hypothetical protein